MHSYNVGYEPRYIAVDKKVKFCPFQWGIMTQICHAEISLVLSMFTLHVGNVIAKVYV